MIKPDGLRGNYTDRIKRTIVESGFRILKERIVELDEDRAGRFYAEHSSKSFFSNLVKYMTRCILNLRNVVKFPMQIIICIILYVLWYCCIDAGVVPHRTFVIASFMPAFEPLSLCINLLASGAYPSPHEIYAAITPPSACTQTKI